MLSVDKQVKGPFVFPNRNLYLILTTQEINAPYLTASTYN